MQIKSGKHDTATDQWFHGPPTFALWSASKGYFFITHEYKYTSRPILANFHGTIFSGGKRPRDKIFNWSSSLKGFTTADLSLLLYRTPQKFCPASKSAFSLNATRKQLPDSETI